MSEQDKIAEALAAAKADIEWLTPYVDAFRREEARADKLGRELDDLRARIEALEAAVREHHDAWRGAIGHLNKAAARIEALEAALRAILDIGDASSGSDWGDLTVSRDIARAALTA